MHDRGAARERPEESDHEVDRVIRGQDAEVAHTWPKRIKRGERDALFEVIFVRHHAAFGTAARAGRIDDAGYFFARAWNECWFAAAAKFFPALSATEVSVRWCFRHENGAQVRRGRAARSYAQLPPNRIFGDQNFRAGVLEQFPLLIRRKFVVERNHHAAAEKNRVGGN